VSIRKDLGHLRWLSIFHIIAAGISILLLRYTLNGFYFLYDAVGKNHSAENPQAVNQMKLNLLISGGLYTVIEILRIIATFLSGIFINS